MIIPLLIAYLLSLLGFSCQFSGCLSSLGNTPEGEVSGSIYHPLDCSHIHRTSETPIVLQERKLVAMTSHLDGQFCGYLKKEAWTSHSQTYWPAGKELFLGKRRQRIHARAPKGSTEGRTHKFPGLAPWQLCGS